METTNIENTEMAAAPTTEPFFGEAQAFTIDTVDKLTWWLRKRANLTAERDWVKAQAAAMLAQIDSDLQGLAYLEPQAADFTRQELERRGGRRKSLTTLQGTCSFRTTAPRLTVADEAAAIAAARSYQSVATREGFDLLPQTLDKGAFVKFTKSELERTGEMLPGVATIEARESFSVPFKGDTNDQEEAA